MAIGLGLLRLSPADFWAMTTREFAALTRLSARNSATPLRRRDLERLMQDFPDNED